MFPRYCFTYIPEVFLPAHLINSQIISASRMVEDNKGKEGHPRQKILLGQMSHVPLTCWWFNRETEASSGISRGPFPFFHVYIRASIAHM